MIISELISILSNIKNNIGDMEIILNYKPYNSGDLNPQGCYEDLLDHVQITKDNKLCLTNEFRYYNKYNGCSCDVIYDEINKVYKGTVTPEDKIDGFNLSFTCPNVYQIEDSFIKVVNEYNDFLSNAKITRTMDAVNNIIDNNNYDESDTDLDYGELEDNPNNDGYESSDDDYDYGET